MRSTPAAHEPWVVRLTRPPARAHARACIRTRMRTCAGAHMRLCSCSCAHASMYARGRGGRAGRATCTMARTAWGSEMSAAHSSTHARLQRALSACVPLESHCAPYWHGIGTLSTRSSPAGLGPLWHQSCTRRVRAALRRSALAGRRFGSSEADGLSAVACPATLRVAACPVPVSGPVVPALSSASCHR